MVNKTNFLLVLIALFFLSGCRNTETESSASSESISYSPPFSTVDSSDQATHTNYEIDYLIGEWYSASPDLTLTISREGEQFVFKFSDKEELWVSSEFYPALRNSYRFRFPNVDSEHCFAFQSADCIEYFFAATFEDGEIGTGVSRPIEFNRSNK